MTRPLTGQESSILALIAQSGSLLVKDEERILAKLKGRAKSIALVMLGRPSRAGKDVKTAAYGFLKWGKQ